MNLARIWPAVGTGILIALVYLWWPVCWPAVCAMVGGVL